MRKTFMMIDYRNGIGYDFHRLKKNIPFVLGGVRIPYSKGPLGHSDGDVLLHALVDALLGGIAEGDIGSFFSDHDPRWEKADSKIFVEHARKLVKKKKFSVHFVDAVVLAEKPKLQPYFVAIRKSLSSLLLIPLSRVSLKAKTAEGVGIIGKGDGIAAFVSVMLRKT
jgi:2-C-methyl-D-erythritol 2,4-cyclodiphosphate synthase